eukprot:5341684-Prymnesium_polylepis.1
MSLVHVVSARERHTPARVAVTERVKKALPMLRRDLPSSPGGRGVSEFYKASAASLPEALVPLRARRSLGLLHGRCARTVTGSG